MVDVNLSRALTQAAARLPNARPIAVVPPAVAGFIPTPFNPATPPATRIEAVAQLYGDAYHDLLSPTAPTIPGTDRFDPAVSRSWLGVVITLPRQNAIFDGFDTIVTRGEVFNKNSVLDAPSWAAMRASIALVRGGVEAIFPDRDDLRQAVTLKALQIWRVQAALDTDFPTVAAINHIANTAAHEFIRDAYLQRITETIKTRIDASLALPTGVADRIGRQLRLDFTLPETLTHDGLDAAAAWAESILDGLSGDNLAARTTLARILIDGSFRDSFEQLPADQQMHVLFIVATEIGQDAARMLTVTQRALDLRIVLSKPPGRLAVTEIEDVLAVITYGQEPLDFTVVPAEQRKPLKVATITWAQTQAWANADATTMAEHAAYRQQLLAPIRERLALYVPAQALGAEVVALHAALNALLEDPSVVAAGSDTLRDLIGDELNAVVNMAATLDDVTVLVLARIRSDLLARRISMADLETMIEERRIAIEAAADAAAAGGGAGGGNGGNGGGAPDDDDGAGTNAGPGRVIV